MTAITFWCGYLAEAIAMLRFHVDFIVASHKVENENRKMSQSKQCHSLPVLAINGHNGWMSSGDLIVAPVVVLDFYFVSNFVCNFVRIKTFLIGVAFEANCLCGGDNDGRRQENGQVAYSVWLFF